MSTSGGTAALDGFTYYGRDELVRIDSLSPGRGPVGTGLTVHGSGFNGDASKNVLMFGGRYVVPASGNDTTLWVSVPVGAMHEGLGVLNKETGRMGRGVPYRVGNGPVSVSASNFGSAVSLGLSGWDANMTVTHDMDGDGKLDIVVGYLNEPRVSVLRNQSSAGSLGEGSFVKTDYGIGNGQHRVAVGDLDGDGRPEIVVSNSMDNTVSVMRNVSTPGSLTASSFEGRVDIGVVSLPWDVEIADVDLDGRADIVVGGYSNSVGILRNVHMGPGSFTSSSFALTGIPGAAISLAVGDLDGDRKPEIVVGKTGSSIEVFHNRSSRGMLDGTSFAPGISFPTGGWVAAAIGIEDMNDDGKPELIVANSDAGTVSVLRNRHGTGPLHRGSFAYKEDYALSSSGTYRLKAADMNGDGKTDIVTLNGTSIGYLQNAMPTGATAFNASSFANSVILVANAGGSSNVSLNVADYDGDLLPDLATSIYNLRIYRNTAVLPMGVIGSLDCGSAVHNGTLAAGAPASAAGTTVGYTGGNGGSYAAISVSSTGVTGLTATLERGALRTGEGSLTFYISGVAATAGTATFSFQLGGQSCSFSRTVYAAGTPPSVTTGMPEGIVAGSARCGGTVTAAGASHVGMRGIVWSLSPGPTVETSAKVLAGSGTGAFTVELRRLLGGTTYYVRAFATNAAGTGYGTELSFMTGRLPVVGTLAVGQIGLTTALGGGNVTDAGSGAVSARGIVWDTRPNPVVGLDSKTVEGSGVGTFSSTMTGLRPGTRYYVRAYATSAMGTYTSRPVPAEGE